MLVPFVVGIVAGVLLGNALAWLLRLIVRKLRGVTAPMDKGKAVCIDARGAMDPSEVEAIVHHAMQGYAQVVSKMAVQAMSDFNSRRPKSGRI